MLTILSFSFGPYPKRRGIVRVIHVKLLLPKPTRKNKSEHNHHPLLTPLQNVLTLKPTPPLAATSKTSNQTKLPSSPTPSTTSNQAPRPGTSFADALKTFPTAPNRNSINFGMFRTKHNGVYLKLPPQIL